MSNPEVVIEAPVEARVVHRSVLVDGDGSRQVVKLMLNLHPQGRKFEAGGDIAFLLPGECPEGGLRRYTVEAVGKVPFEDSVDITLYVRDHGVDAVRSMAPGLMALQPGGVIDVYGPMTYPFYPPMGSRSNVIMIGAGCGVVPFRWLARNIQARKLDWMGKVLMLEGESTGLERLYQNEPAGDQDQYFDNASYKAFEALKTRYSAGASDRSASTESNRDAVWRLMGQGRVFVYVAGYRAVADAMNASMSEHLRLSGRWHEARAELIRSGHWLECLHG